MKFYKNSYGEEMGKEQFMSLQSLIKHNDGLFKSDKQGKFILWKWTLTEEFVNDSWIVHNIEVNEEHKYISVDGYLSFGHGKGKGHRPIEYLYELDHVGVVKRYRVRFTGDEDSYSLKSVEVDWERTVETPPKKVTEVIQEVSEVKESNWFGDVGERYNDMKLTVKFIHGFDSDFGYTFIHKMEDEKGNQFTWFTGKCLEKDKTYTMNATVKSHDEYKGTKQTVLTRCMKVKEVS